MNILLTGANGYIGKRILPSLIDQGHHVICCVRDQKRFTIEDKYLNSTTVLEVDFLEEKTLHKIPENIETIDVDPMPLPNLLKHVGLAPSTSEARRLIGQKALKIDDHVVDSIDYELKKGSYILKLGKKKFAQVNVKK